MKLLSLAASLFVATYSVAYSQGLGDCDDSVLRQTVIYVDDTDLVKSDTIWALNISFKLTGSMIPGEKLSIVELSPKNATSKELWHGCWPRGNDLKSIDVLKQQITFSQQVNDVLSDISNRVRHDQAAPQGQNPPQKQIIKSLAGDIDRYKKATHSTVRAVIYSDMAENSDLGSAFSPPSSELFNNKLNVYFVHGVFYAYGLGRNIVNAQDFNQNAKSFWKNAIKAMGGVVESITTEFSIPPVFPQSSSFYNVSLQYGAERLPGKMAIMVDKNGNLVDSWIGISHLTAAGLAGNIACIDQLCKISAKTTSGLTGYGGSEDVQILVSPNSSMSGFVVNEADQFYLDGNKR